MLKKILVAIAITVMSAGVCLASSDAEEKLARLELMEQFSMPTIEAEPGSPGDIFKDPKPPVVIIIKKD